jgi:hypothetical protein
VNFPDSALWNAVELGVGLHHRKGVAVGLTDFLEKNKQFVFFSFISINGRGIYMARYVMILWSANPPGKCTPQNHYVHGRINSMYIGKFMPMSPKWDVQGPN